MKKYFIADILTLCEIIAAVVLLFLKTSMSELALFIFAFGELCDAFDGPCARRWPYPDDGKHRWWRIPSVVQFIEHASDILILIACSLFLLRQPSLIVRLATLILGTTIGIYCLHIELKLHSKKLLFLEDISFRYKPFHNYGRTVILARRLDYILDRRRVYLLGITMGVALLISVTRWHLLIKLVLYLIGIVIAILLIFMKQNRLHNV